MGCVPRAQACWLNFQPKARPSQRAPGVPSHHCCCAVLVLDGPQCELNSLLVDITDAVLCCAGSAMAPQSELNSFLVEITSLILGKADDRGEGWLVDKILDKTGMKGTGKWTVQQAAELAVASPTIEAALDGRFLSGLKEERVAAAKFYEGLGVAQPVPDLVGGAPSVCLECCAPPVRRSVCPPACLPV
jgi:6-phosphogluconate dehydrogenase, C-terminal domain